MGCHLVLEQEGELAALSNTVEVAVHLVVFATCRHKAKVCSTGKVPRESKTVGKMVWRQDKAAALWIFGRLEIMVMGSSGTVLNDRNHTFLLAEQLQERIIGYRDLKSGPELHTGPIPPYVKTKKVAIMSSSAYCSPV